MKTLEERKARIRATRPYRQRVELEKKIAVGRARRLYRVATIMIFWLVFAGLIILAVAMAGV